MSHYLHLISCFSLTINTTSVITEFQVCSLFHEPLIRITLDGLKFHISIDVCELLDFLREYHPIEEENYMYLHYNCISNTIHSNLKDNNFIGDLYSVVTYTRLS